MNLPEILHKIRPGEKWTINGDAYEGLTWLSLTTKPTLKEIEAAWPEVQIELAKKALSPLAQAALDASDITILRCYEFAVSVPIAWATYRNELRAIVSLVSEATELPERPDYPAGT